MSAYPPLDWTSRRACDQDDNLWFATDPTLIGEAKSICSECPVTDECLECAMTAEDGARTRYGVFGGMSGAERVLLTNLRAELGSIGLAADAMGITRRAAQSALERHHRPGGAA
jgi:hypothetical protein